MCETITTEMMIWFIDQIVMSTDPASALMRSFAKGELHQKFPLIAKMAGVPQSLNHPEGDVLHHAFWVLHYVSQMTENKTARFCAVFHDIGKLLTPKEELPKHKYHSIRGAEMLQEILDKSNLSEHYVDYIKAAIAVCKWHMPINWMTDTKDIIQLIRDMQQNVDTAFALECVLLCDSKYRRDVNGEAEYELPWFFRNYIFEELGDKSDEEIAKELMKIKEDPGNALGHKVYNLPLSQLSFNILPGYDWEAASGYVDWRIELDDDDIVPFEFDDEDHVLWIDPEKLRKMKEMAKQS